MLNSVIGLLSLVLFLEVIVGFFHEFHAHLSLESAKTASHLILSVQTYPQSPNMPEITAPSPLYSMLFRKENVLFLGKYQEIEIAHRASVDL